MADFLNLRSTAAADPIRNFRFLVSFIPLASGGNYNSNTTFQGLNKINIGFMAVQGLAAQTETIPYREGGMNTTPHQLPGQQSFSPVTFQKGVLLGSMMGWEWFSSLYNPGIRRGGSADTASNGTGENVVTDFRFEVRIKVLKYPATHNRTVTQTSQDVSTAASFTLLNAWPSNLAYSDLNAADNAVLVEQITVVHEGLVPQASADGVFALGSGKGTMGPSSGVVE